MIVIASDFQIWQMKRARGGGGMVAAFLRCAAAGVVVPWFRASYIWCSWVSKVNLGFCAHKEQSTVAVHIWFASQNSLRQCPPRLKSGIFLHNATLAVCPNFPSLWVHSGKKYNCYCLKRAAPGPAPASFDPKKERNKDQRHPPINLYSATKNSRQEVTKKMGRKWIQQLPNYVCIWNS